MDLSSTLSPSDTNRLEGPYVSKKPCPLFFSPMDTDERDQQESDVLTPKRRLSLSMDDSTQSPHNDAGYGESIGSCVSVDSGDGLTLESASRSPLVELNFNTPSGAVCKRKTLQAKRLRNRPTSLITEKSPLSENAINSAPLAFKPPSYITHSTRPTSLPPLDAHSTRPLSLPSLSQPDLTESWPMPSVSHGSGSSLIRHISSPLERMTLMSPTVPSVFTFESQSSTHSHRSTSTTESDGYFSEIEVFENEEPADSTSDTIKTLLNAPLAQDAPITFTAKAESGFPCPIPIRPMPPSHSTISSQFNPTATRKPSLQNARSSSLKRSSPSSELSQFHQPKRPPLPFLHCSNSQDSPIAATVGPLPHHRNQLKGRSLLRSQSYCMPPVVGDGKTAPSLSGELIGDESMPYALPLVRGSSPELKCISPETLSKLLAGEFSDIVDTYSIIDCRYPYEFEGGHIQGAVNIWEKGDLLEKFFTNPEHPNSNQRTIYIFHCEFSSKRGPEMCRFLRKIDRERNGLEFFPKLYYPELYLLDGGYKAFYQTFSELCEPKNYCLMLDERYKEDLRHCKQRTKSWTSDSLLQSRRQGPSRCRRRTTVHFESRPKSNSLNSTSSGLSSGRTDTDQEKMN